MSGSKGRSAHIDALLQESSSRIPGIAVAAVVGGSVVYSGAAGRAEEGGPEDIGAYIPTRIFNPTFPETPITARQLLTHTAGLNDNEDALLPGRYRSEGTDCSVTLEEYVRERFGSTEYEAKEEMWSQTHAPGLATYHYSNAGFTLLGWVVQCASGRSVASLAQERIFDPLGMTRTKYFLADMKILEDTDLAIPHDEDRKGVGHYGVAEWPAAQGVRTHVYIWPGRKAGLVILTNGSEDYSDIERCIYSFIEGLTAPRVQD
ncbi:hypothetical protein CYMTET_10398 [Cymbomonas tetramitiformis]|uniref:Beta-lactamase-related domain-containing protein n=1 Tax=Cymbomonas tetramitiformis TaxID=36881 RepID=A0AAE0LE79_9CHLO|nr:hypothetical protein CYMTET_10398 [Cymbomonas tetramitiformis]